MKKTVSKVIAAGSLVALSIPAAAATWNVIWDNVSAKTVWMFDSEGIVKKNGNTLVWANMYFNPKTAKGNVVQSKVRYSINCANRTLQTLSVTDYGPDGNVQNSSLASSAIADAIPDTLGEGLVIAVCAPSRAKALGGTYSQISNKLLPKDLATALMEQAEIRNEERRLNELKAQGEKARVSE